MRLLVADRNPGAVHVGDPVPDQTKWDELAGDPETRDLLHDMFGG